MTYMCIDNHIKLAGIELKIENSVLNVEYFLLHIQFPRYVTHSIELHFIDNQECLGKILGFIRLISHQPYKFQRTTTTKQLTCYKTIQKI